MGKIMKDKKDLRNNTKSTRYFLIAAKIVAIITAVVFFVMLSRGTVNAAIFKGLSNQYQDRQLGVLKKDVNQNTMGFIGNVINLSGDKLVTKSNIANYRKIKTQLNDRKQRTHDVNALYAGKNKYQNDVTSQKLDKLDKQLLKETNQDVYQVVKNKLDTVRIWFEQTQDGILYINQTWDKFNDDKTSLSMKNISMVNTYNKLIKNDSAKQEVSDKVSELNKYFDSNSGEDTKLKNAKAELDALKNSPLTMKYKPANVDIITDLDSSTSAADVLSAAGITDKHVLYFDKSNGTISYMSLSDGHYQADGDFINVSAGTVASGRYTIKALINSASNNAAIVTDHSSTSFGKYLANATDDSLNDLGINNAENSTSNFNSASPVFWLKNNASLSRSIYFGGSNTLGFIYSGGTSYSNGIQVSNSDLSTLLNKTSTGLLFYVK